MAKLLDEKPINKDAVEEAVTLLRKRQLEIGSSIYKEAAKKERKEAGVKKAKETRAKTKNKNRNTRNTSKPRNVRTR